MSLSLRNQLLVLGVLCSIWAALALWRATRWEEPARVPLTNVSGRVSGQLAVIRRGTTGQHVNRDLLAASRTSRETTFTTPRNIFAPLRPEAAPAINTAQPFPPAPDQTSPESVQQQTAMAELAQFRYLGYLQLGDAQPPKERALLVKQDEVLVVKAGETIEDRFLVKAITPDGVTLKETGSRVEQIVPLAQEPEPQQPSP